MRSSFLIALVAALLVVGGYWYQSTAAVCPVPLSYHIGDIDPSFDLSEAQAKTYATEAEAAWESAVGRDLFDYNDSKGIAIQFVYDERQELADSEAHQREVLDGQRDESEAVRNTLENLQAQYNELSATYETRVAAYNDRLDAYNAKVTKYNDQGGAPPKEFERLEAAHDELNAEARSLASVSDQLSNLADQINRLADKGNALVDTYNEKVNEYNQAFGYEREFTQGDYQTLGYINVYKFSSEPEVVRVLAHEFGHSLGLDHVEGTSSLMYYLLEDTDHMPVLSADDLAAYYSMCGTEETFGQKVRRVVREILVKFK